MDVNPEWIKIILEDNPRTDLNPKMDQIDLPKMPSVPIIGKEKGPGGN